MGQMDGNEQIVYNIDVFGYAVATVSRRLSLLFIRDYGDKGKKIYLDCSTGEALVYLGI